MKTFLFFGNVLLVLFFSSFIEAVPIQTPSPLEKLSSSINFEKVKDNLPNESDESVNELDKLKTHSLSNKMFDFPNNLEDSLKKLHYEKLEPYGDVQGQVNFSPGHDALEATSIRSIPASQKEKEVLEILPIIHDSEVTSLNPTRIDNRRTIKGEMMTLNASTMLRQLNGKYSAYDMAQYIFWTGDEKGVAQAVEELIKEDLMSRENAIEFLNDIRLGLDYLENTYSLKSEESKNIHDPTTTTKTVSPIDEIAFNSNFNYEKFHSFFKPNHKVVTFGEDNAPTISPAGLKALEKLPSLIKMTKMHKDKERHDLETALDEERGRTRLADFLYGEYSLEEVIYQLAKTMFLQSLSHGSEESQAALQKLTEFLENEGIHGRISPSLQKKILDVLLAALSDTLSENPEAMEQARHALITK